MSSSTSKRPSRQLPEARLGPRQARHARLPALGLSLIALCAACGIPWDKQVVIEHFEQQFACKPDSVRGSGAHYTATGCGIRADYSCFRDRGGRREQPSLLVGSDACVQEDVHFERGGKAGSAPPQPQPGIQLTKTEDGKPLLRLFSQQPAMRLHLAMSPALDSQSVAWTLELPGATFYHPQLCEASLWVDGDPVEIGGTRYRQAKAGRQRFSFLSDLEALRRLDRRDRVNLVVCDRDYVLEARTRQQLTQFHVRARELAHRTAVPGADSD